MQKVRFNGAVAAFDILIDDNIDSQNQSADIEPPVFDSQTPLSDKRIFQEIASNDYNNSSETDSSSNANVSPSNTEKKELLVPLEVETMTILASMLENEAFDTGISNASEKYFEKLFCENKVSTMNGISTLSACQRSHIAS